MSEAAKQLRKLAADADDHIREELGLPPISGMLNAVADVMEAISQPYRSARCKICDYPGSQHQSRCLYAKAEQIASQAKGVE